MTEKMTREQLVAALADLDERDRKNDADMAPFREIATKIEEEREALLEANETLVIGPCEGCSTIILDGDRYMAYSDGPRVCLSCAPTWAESAADLRTYTCDDPEDEENRLAAIAHAETQIAVGLGDQKVC